MKKLFNQKSQKPVRQKLRNNMTSAKQLLWMQLRGKQLSGYKFRRQQGIGKYIVDFYCSIAELIVEVDGDTHFGEKAERYDAMRDTFMEERGIRVLRFTNLDIRNNLDNVIEKIFYAINNNPTSPPLEEREEG